MTAYGSRLVIAVLGVGIGLLLLIGILYLIRRRSGPSPFLRGGKNRQPRLQVLDAAAVDARRRIVLIRRDNVEHLVMIGGPTDVVIESGIGAARDGETLAYSTTTALPSAASSDVRLDAPPPQRRIAAAKPDVTVAPTAPAASILPKIPPAEAQAQSAPLQRAEPIKPLEPVMAAAKRPQEGQKKPTAIEPVVMDPVPTVQPMTEPVRPTNGATEVSKAPDIGAASDALDAARRRVFQPAADRSPTPAPVKTEPAVLSPTSAEKPVQADAPVSPPPQPATKAPDTETAKPRSLGSEFDRILEEEMANNLSTQRSDPANPRVTGATAEPMLQNEIARIFGEMSVTRDGK
ncbi:flagellar biosynthetic protein FliO [Rhizobium sp. FKY42]|uniref:flagellar biosynthetic protein FliO n=1 Tax=Rhizobium sp. FKY42 TaxID=2562310 RepID=UPI001FEEFA58|nr:flagellar biosynthetic protein FliO [Rhizobium sp. FKY42]